MSMEKEKIKANVRVGGSKHEVQVHLQVNAILAMIYFYFNFLVWPLRVCFACAWKKVTFIRLRSSSYGESEVYAQHKGKRIENYKKPVDAIPHRGKCQVAPCCTGQIPENWR
ncbi:uncharacterized protein LOC133303543 [Gastrolobium bilobum]|uniref:uncharacterized protein LOC133303543 n=1 Tax=Gastrolobium bilobum TaxID=150636 RepID=UPI002AB30E44|nr:uncharacterized protein LOC133303543 [Gastrolobium bilobum]